MGENCGVRREQKVRKQARKMVLKVITWTSFIYEYLLRVVLGSLGLLPLQVEKWAWS